MFAIVLCALAAAADDQPEYKQPPALLLVKLDGDMISYRFYAAVSRAVKKVVEVDDNGKKVKKEVIEHQTGMELVENRFDLKKAKFSTAGGKKLDLEAVKKRLAKPQVVAMAMGYKPVDEAFLKVLDKDAIVIVPEKPKPDEGKKPEK
jgi:hypothetical protein